MKFSAPLCVSFVALLTLAFHPSAQATTLGLSTDPAGNIWDRNDPNTGYAVWDKFATFQVSNDAPDDTAGITNPFLTQTGPLLSTAQGGGLYDFLGSGPGTTSIPGTDILFPGGNSVNFTLTGTVDFTIGGVVLQIKRAGSLLTLNDNNGFTPKLTLGNGDQVTADAISFTSGSGDTNTTSGNYSVTRWTWTSSLKDYLNTAGNTYTLEFSKTASQRTLDAIVVDVAAIPEPASIAVLLGGCGMLGMLRPRRRV